MPKPTITMKAVKAKSYNGAVLRPGQLFQARPGDAKILKHLGWAADAPPAPKPASGKTYATKVLTAEE